jgi:uncharacterized protein YqeY
MAQLKDQLKKDLTDAIKSHNQVISGTLRMALTAVTNEEVAGKESRELSDNEVLSVLTKEAKKRRESVDAYMQANRKDLADKESAELTVLEKYLPAALSEQELEDIIAKAITEATNQGATGMKAMGIVMKIIQPQTLSRVCTSSIKYRRCPPTVLMQCSFPF